MDDSSSLVLKHLLSDHALKARLSAAVASAAPLGSRRLGAAPRGTDDRGLSPLRPVRVRVCRVCGVCTYFTGVHGNAPARAYTWYQPLYVLYCLWRCVPAYSLVLAAVWLRVARHEEELPY